MIRIKQHENFKDWFNILLENSLFDQIKGKANALQFAEDLSRKTGKMVHQEYMAGVKKKS